MNGGNDRAGMPPDARPILGRGFRFPIQVDAGGGLSLSEGPDRVRDAIWIVIRTGFGERLMRPTFGAGADEELFGPNDGTTRARLSAKVRDALLKWEPRVDVDAVDVRPDVDEPGRANASMRYRIRDTNEVYNLVFPFYPVLSVTWCIRIGWPGPCSPGRETDGTTTGFPFYVYGPRSSVDRGVRRRGLIPRFTVLLDEALIECRLYPINADHGALGQEFPMHFGQRLDRRLVAPIDVQKNARPVPRRVRNEEA